MPLRTSAMPIPGRPGAVGRFARMPTTDRGRMSSSKALLSRAATRTHFALLIVLEGAVAMREPLPVSTWYALEQREWRIASTKHTNSYLFRVDKGEDDGAGICTPATVGACCGDSATRAWYVAAAGKSTPAWIAFVPPLPGTACPAPPGAAPPRPRPPASRWRLAPAPAPPWPTPPSSSASPLVGRSVPAALHLAPCLPPPEGVLV